MIGYVLLGSNQLEQAVLFYDQLMVELGAQRAMGTDRIFTWSTGEGPMLGVCTPANGEPATSGNGTMVALAMPDRETVDRVYARAMEVGATCAGAPSTTDTPGFYGAYVRDLDNNKLCFFHL